MGLALSVGILADLKVNDPEGYDCHKASFVRADELLTEYGIRGHTEPDEGAPWDAEMFGYSGLHYLRRLAAFLDCGQPIPQPGDNDSSDDPVLQGYFDAYTGDEPGFLQRLFKKPARYP